MPAGEAFTDNQRREIDKAIRDAERLSGHRFSVYVGASDDNPRRHAESLHARLPDRDDTIFVHVDPHARAIEIVTGERVLGYLDNRRAALAALTMQTTFATGALTEGLIAGLQQLASLSRRDAPLHTDTP